MLSGSAPTFLANGLRLSTSVTHSNIFSSNWAFSGLIQKLRKSPKACVLGAFLISALAEKATVFVLLKALTHHVIQFVFQRWQLMPQFIRERIGVEINKGRIEPVCFTHHMPNEVCLIRLAEPAAK